MRKRVPMKTILLDCSKPMWKMVKLDTLGDKRLIPGGNFLRATGLDELAQLLNVIKGEMSLVGPRPCTLKEYGHYKSDQMQRFDVLPGITGYWQVKGKNQTTFLEMLEMDEHYVEHNSVFLDFLIVLRTPLVLFLQLIDLIEFRICGTAAKTDTGNSSHSASDVN